MRQNPQKVAQDDELIDQRGFDHAIFLPAPSTGEDRNGSDRHLAHFFQPLDQREVFHDGQFWKPTDLAEDLCCEPDRLIVVGQSQSNVPNTNHDD